MHDLQGLGLERGGVGHEIPVLGLHALLGLADDALGTGLQALDRLDQGVAVLEAEQQSRSIGVHAAFLRVDGRGAAAQLLEDALTVEVHQGLTGELDLGPVLGLAGGEGLEGDVGRVGVQFLGDLLALQGEALAPLGLLLCVHLSHEALEHALVGLGNHVLGELRVGLELPVRDAHVRSRGEHRLGGRDLLGGFDLGVGRVEPVEHTPDLVGHGHVQLVGALVDLGEPAGEALERTPQVFGGSVALAEVGFVASGELLVLLGGERLAVLGPEPVADLTPVFLDLLRHALAPGHFLDHLQVEVPQLVERGALVVIQQAHLEAQGLAVLADEVQVASGGVTRGGGLKQGHAFECLGLQGRGDVEAELRRIITGLGIHSLNGIHCIAEVREYLDGRTFWPILAELKNPVPIAHALQ